MSTAEGITVAPELANMQRNDDGIHEDTPLLAPRRHHVRSSQHGAGGPCDILANHLQAPARYLDRHLDDLRNNLVDDVRDDLRNYAETWGHCLLSCFSYFFCHAFCIVLLNVCHCRCLACAVKMPEYLEPKNRTQKFLAFFIRNLSKLWVTTLLVLFARWVLFRPIDVKPNLGASVVHELELQPSFIGAPNHLRFDLTAYLLLKNRHKSFYKVSYNHLAVSVLYAGEKLGPVDDELPSFKQEPLERTVMRLVFVGRLRNASATVAETFAGERDKGVFKMVVRIRVTLSYRSWPFKQDYFTIHDCPLSSPFPRVDGEPAVSSPTLCKTMDI
ncbi:unnamed protein product [Urochloa decumbens]|uniref:Late embryogenesis abundant protein LEA-2 subgroup domain-containing protein n=1 Tax=Urochloa decumbens TaxID=240449 RepID=A0ABC9AQ16_9POAL